MRFVAVSVVGVPARILQSILADLRQRFSDRYVFRGVGASLFEDRLNRYDNSSISIALKNTAEVIFGKNNKPYGFCRNPAQPCGLATSSTINCGLRAGASCTLKKPNFLIVAYQEGHHEEIFLQKLHYSAHLIKIRRPSCNKKEKTLQDIIDGIKNASEILGAVKKELASFNSPLFLPPINFADPSLSNLLKGWSSSGDRPDIASVRRTIFHREGKYYSYRKNIRFSPAAINALHGISDPKEVEDVAITRAFRLGCEYNEAFHYDVSQIDGRHFDGKTTFTCRLKGKIVPKGQKNVNILIDDCLR